MRRWLVILMLLLLPLRAWAGGVMLTSMLAPDPAAGAVTTAVQPPTAAPPCHASVSSEPADHHAQGQALEAVSHPSHLLCDICNVPALSTTVLQLHLPEQLRSPIPPRLMPFASVWPSRDSRPPIA